MQDHPSKCPLDRRTFLKRAAAATGGLTGAAMLGPTPAWSRTRAAAGAGAPPNILLLMVDQWRQPPHSSPQAQHGALLPALAKLRSESVTFSNFYTAATACSPARSTFVTGLYTHQTGLLLTMPLNRDNGVPGLNPGFPTYGSMLSSLGYRTWFWGKWHLSADSEVGPYGYSGGTMPSPNGNPGQGLMDDPSITQQFEQWLDEHGAEGPWCTTVSWVNPHDIAWYPRYTRLIKGERTAPRVFSAAPVNFESRADLRHKPSLQRSLQERLAETIGPMPLAGPSVDRAWAKMLDVYLRMEYYAGQQVAAALSALERRPDIAKRTIVLFTSDHGEHGGAHGLRDKGGTVYEEGIRVPLWVKDPTGRYVRDAKRVRTQLASSVDIAPLLLTLATGSNAWRRRPKYAQIAGRLDISAILRNPNAAGRSYVVSTADDDATEQGLRTPYAKDAPRHVIGYRAPGGKYATYSDWQPGTTKIETEGQELEAYDYRTKGGRLELDNVAHTDPGFSRAMAHRLNAAIRSELREPLPSALKPAQQQAFRAYVDWEASQS